jgi:Sir2- and TIR-associating SLOG family/SIR2-like domain
MSAEAISESIFVREYTRELHNKNAAVFAGAGLSLASGYVDWKNLLRTIVTDLRLDPDREYDLVTLAQYHCNQAGGNKARLTQTIFDHFAVTKKPTPNHRILAQLPIQIYWTTNYDKLIETALVEAKKVPDVKYTLKQLAVTKLDRDAVVYKMHGDVDHASDVVISKDDYEAYPIKMGAFVSALRGDLIERTFLFLGFSFTDPNIDYILSRVRVQYEQHQRHHYCIQKKVSLDEGETEESFKYRELKQHYFISDLKRFGIQTVLVEDYPAITALLQKVASQYKRRSVLVSGAAEAYGAWSKEDAESFLYKLSNLLASRKNRIITGFGLGVGSAVINGALSYLDAAGKTATDEEIVMRPFPQVATPGKSLADEWTAYRAAMIDYAGIAIFVFGNKRDADGEIVPSNGMREEFDLSVAAGARALPIGATGFMAEALWKKILDNFAKFFPDAPNDFRRDFESLGDASKNPEQLLAIIQRLIEHLQKG